MPKYCYVFLFYVFLSGGIVFLIFTLLSLMKNKILIVEYGIKSFDSDKPEHDYSSYEIDIDNIRNKLVLQFIVSTAVDFGLAIFLFFWVLKNNNTNKKNYNLPTKLISFKNDEQNSNLINNDNLISNDNLIRNDNLISNEINSVNNL